MVGIVEAFIILCVFGYLLNKARAKDMVDVLQNYMQEAISVVRLPRRARDLDQHHDDERPTAYGLHRTTTEKQRIHHQNKELDKQYADHILYQIKESPMPSMQLPSKSPMNLSCKYCKPTKTLQQNNENSNEQEVINILRVGTYNQYRPKENNSMLNWRTWFPLFSHCISLKWFPYSQISDAVMKDERLRNAIRMSVERSVQEKREQAQQSQRPVDSAAANISAGIDDFDEDAAYEAEKKSHIKRTKQLLYEMRSKISNFLLRVASIVLFKLLPSFMSGVVAHPDHIEMLKRVAKESPNVPLIFLPLHRSHLDYILVSFILYNNHVRAPIVAAGNNLNIPFFGALLRGLGAFFIKRKIDPVAGKKDIVYRAVLHTYMQHALSAGHYIEFFIEGGRTRTGKPCMPKSGVLSVIIDALDDGTINDALLVPVSVNYERLADGNFVYEQLGEKKQPETFTSAVKAIWNIINSKYGQMRIDFNEPFSLKELVSSFNKSSDTNEPVPQKLFRHANSSSSLRRLRHQPSTSSLYGTDVVNEDHRQLVDSIARHVVYDCSTATAVMTTNAVSFLLLTRFRDGATIRVMAEALDDLRALLNYSRAISFTGESRDVIDYAAKLLGPSLIVSEKRKGEQFYKPVQDKRSFIELSYYSNSLAAHFALDSVVICAAQKRLQMHEKVDPNKEFEIGRKDLIQACIEYCDILRYEFLFNKPCQQLNDLLEDAFDRLRSQSLMALVQDPLACMKQGYNRNPCSFLDMDSSDYEYQETDDRFILPSEGHDKRLVLMSVIVPYSHAYLAVAHSLPKLLNCMLPEADFVRLCIGEITRKYESAECRYGESISTDTIRNCMKMLEKQNYIEVAHISGIRHISLNKKYESSGRVSEIIERIESVITF